MIDKSKYPIAWQLTSLLIARTGIDVETFGLKRVINEWTYGFRFESDRVKDLRVRLKARLDEGVLCKEWWGSDGWREVMSNLDGGSFHIKMEPNYVEVHFDPTGIATGTDFLGTCRYTLSPDQLHKHWKKDLKRDPKYPWEPLGHFKKKYPIK
jgi:hypothetical protein